MSDTPRTDEATWNRDWDWTIGSVVTVGFARQLERELTADNETIKRLQEALEFYADNDNWYESNSTLAIARLDYGTTARQALEVNNERSTLR